MGKSLKGKKILLLGGHAHMLHIVDKCKELGVYTIVTDYNPANKSPAKYVADEVYDVSTLDVLKLRELAVKCNVDGIMAGYSDINSIPAAQLCEELGFPTYATVSQLKRTLNKRKFKELCRQHDIPVAEDIPTDIYMNHPEKITFPIIVKPADSYSSRGISVCNEPKEVSRAIRRALSFSTSNEAIVERYITGDDVYLYFTVQSGKASLSAMADRTLHNDKEGFAPQPIGYSFPSKYIKLYYDEIHEKLQEMIMDLGLKNGSFFLQGFAQRGHLIFFEMGLRLSGGAGYVLIRDQNEIDQVEMHIRYALTGEFGPWDVVQYDNPCFKRPAFVFVVLLKAGIIGDIHGIEEIKHNDTYVDVLQLRGIGDEIKASEKGTLNQVFARIYLCADNKTSLSEGISEVKRTLKVSDVNGNNMILNMNGGV